MHSAIYMYTISFWNFYAHLNNLLLLPGETWAQLSSVFGSEAATVFQVVFTLSLIWIFQPESLPGSNQDWTSLTKWSTGSYIYKMQNFLVRISASNHFSNWRWWRNLPSSRQLPLPTSLRMDASVTIIKSNVQCSALSTRFRLVRQLGIADDCIALGFGVSVILGSSAESPRYRYSNTCWKGILACTASPLSWTIQHKPHVFRILERLSKSTTRKFDWNQTRSGSCIDKPDEHNWSEKVCCPGGYVCAQHNV